MCLELFNPKRIIKRVRSRESLKPYPCWRKTKPNPKTNNSFPPAGLQQWIPLNFHYKTLKGAVGTWSNRSHCALLSACQPPSRQSVLLLWKPSSALASMVLSFPASPPTSLISFSTSFGGPSYLPPTFVRVLFGWVFYPHLFLLCILSLVNLSCGPHSACSTLLFLSCV